jgi:hypothetical protein
MVALHLFRYLTLFLMQWMQRSSPVTNKQPLGGLVSHCWIRSKVMKTSLFVLYSCVDKRAVTYCITVSVKVVDCVTLLAPVAVIFTVELPAGVSGP